MSAFIKLEDLFEKDLPGLHWGAFKDENDLLRRAARNGRNNKVTRCITIAWWLLKNPENELSSHAFANGLWRKDTDEYEDATNFFRSKTSHFKNKEGPPYFLSPSEIAETVSERAIIVGYLFLCLSNPEPEAGNRVIHILEKLKISKTPPQPHHGLVLSFSSANTDLEVEQVKVEPNHDHQTSLIKMDNPMPKGKRFIPKWRRRGIGAVALFFLVFGTAFIVNRINPRIIKEIAAKNGAEEAIAFAKASVFDPSDKGNYIYNLGFAYYLNLEYERAREMAYTLLSSSKADPTSRGKAFYLTALTFAKSDPENALTYLDQARPEFLESGQWQRLYLTEIESAKAHILIGSLEKADVCLEDSLDFFDKSTVRNKQLSGWYAARSRLELANGHCEKFLEYARLGYQEVLGKDNLGLEAIFLSRLGLAYILNDDYSTGEFFTISSQKLLEQLGDERNSLFNMCNSVLIKTWRGLDFEDDAKFVRTWAEQANDIDLQKHLGLVLSVHCSPE